MQSSSIDNKKEFEMFEKIKSMFRLPSPQVVAMRELEDAQRYLLRAQSGLDYSQSMCQYHQARIKRLTATLNKAEN